MGLPTGFCLPGGLPGCYGYRIVRWLAKLLLAAGVALVMVALL